MTCHFKVVFWTENSSGITMRIGEEKVGPNIERAKQIAKSYQSGGYKTKVCTHYYSQ